MQTDLAAKRHEKPQELDGATTPAPQTNTAHRVSPQDQSVGTGAHTIAAAAPKLTRLSHEHN